MGYRDQSNTQCYPSPMGAGTMKKGLLRENYIAEGHGYHQSQYRKRARRKTKYLNLSSLLSALSFQCLPLARNKPARETE